jgi:2-polyprenyl-6-methoxyphenol hydroxylase-like FAD-dependent oxidoreductase
MERRSNSILNWNDVPESAGDARLPPVTIVGAGLGGLVLARVLHLHGVPAEIYEAEPAPYARTQGGLLDIHADGGQAALAAAGLTEAFRAIVHQGGQATRLLDAAGAVLFEQSDDGAGGRPEVPRGALRRILLDSLPDGTVRWGSRLASVNALGAGRHRLTFEDGLVVVSDLLVGADGAWSKVRPLLSDAVPTYSGVSFVETYLYDVDVRHPAAAEAAGAGALIALAPGHGIFAHREPGAVLHAYVALARSADWFAAIDFNDAASVNARLLAEFAGWSPALTALIADADADPVFRPLHSLPTGFVWPPMSGVTLVGDAAHLAPPAGEGANLALLDGAELAAAIVAHPDDGDAAVSAYEAAMFARSAASAADAHRMLAFCLDERAPLGLLEFFTGAVAEQKACATPATKPTKEH